MAGKETKQQILNVANELFATSGYDCVTMRDIAKQVGITEGAIYRHYDGKEKILDEIIFLLSQKVNYILHSLDKKTMDKYMETETPRQILKRCKIIFPLADFIFLANAFSIVLQEHLTNTSAKDLVVHPLYFGVAERINYVLDRLQERGDIPKFNTTAFSLVWVRFAISTLSLWVSLGNSGIPLEEAEVDYPGTIDWLIESALSGSFQ